MQHGRTCRLPAQIAELLGQMECPFGDAALQLRDCVLAAETCEELFTPLAPNIRLALSGAQACYLAASASVSSAAAAAHDWNLKHHQTWVLGSCTQIDYHDGCFVCRGGHCFKW